jgi:hypothetical protein
MWDWLANAEGVLKSLQLLFIGLAAVALLWLRSVFQSKADAAKALAEVTARLDAHDARLARVEVDLTHLPTAEDFHQLVVQLTRVEGRIETMLARNDAVEKLVARVEQAVTRHESIFSDVGRRT